MKSTSALAAAEAFAATADPQPETLRTALKLATAGIYVLPVWGISADGSCSCGADDCKHAGKHPNGQLAAQGVHSASTDADAVRDWFSSDPGANLGIATGHRLQTGGYLVALDIDPARGGMESLAALEADRGALSRDASTITGGGGLHIFLETPSPLRQSHDQLGVGLELKSGGGYVVAPPSLHCSGSRYRFAAGIVPLHCGTAPDAPAWLADVAQSERRDAPQAALDRASQKLVEEALALGKGAHDTAITLARRLRQEGVQREAAQAVLHAANESARDRDPAVRALPDDEIAKALAWAYESVEVLPTAGRRFEIVRPDLERVRPLEWAWRDRILLGAINLLTGDEGAGKGTVIASITARLSRGELEGDLHGTPATVLLLGDEDSFDLVWTPRLHAAGADFDFIHAVKGSDGSALSLPSDAGRLRELIEETAARVVIFDSLLDNLDSGVDDWRSKQVRSAIAPLRHIAAELGCAVIASLHTNKAKGGSYRQSVSGSHAFNALSRSSLLVAAHPDGPEERRVIARGKGNFGPRPASLEFTIEGRSLTIGGKPIRTSIATSFAESDLTAEDLLAVQRPERTSKASTARDYIKRALADGNWRDAGPIIKHLEGLGVVDRAIRTAREAVGAESRNKPGYQAGTEWRLQGGQFPGERFSNRFSRNGRDETPPRKADSPAIPATPNRRTKVGRLGG